MAQSGQAANHAVRTSGVVAVGMPDHEHRHGHDRGDDREEHRQRDQRDDHDHSQNRQWWDDEESGEDDRGELGDAERYDGCDPGPCEDLFGSLERAGRLVGALWQWRGDVHGVCAVASCCWSQSPKRVSATRASAPGRSMRSLGLMP
jgi:hypothetical protein